MLGLQYSSTSQTVKSCILWLMLVLQDYESQAYQFQVTHLGLSFLPALLLMASEACS